MGHSPIVDQSRAQREVLVRRVVSIAIAIYLSILSGCFSWTEDSEGHLTSMGLPGVPVWQAQPNAAKEQPVTPTEMGFTNQEAANFGGPVLVEPPGQGSRAWRYRWYPNGQNRCEQDLSNLLQARTQSGATGPLPYCTDHPTHPSMQGNAMIF